MYQRVSTTTTGAETVLECAEHDIGAIRTLVFDEDLTSKAVKYIIDLKTGSRAVTDYCEVDQDMHTVRMVIPPQVTEKAGTYEGQLLVLSQSNIDNEFSKWLAKAKAGQTEFLIEGSGTEPEATDEGPLAANLTFTFKIRVYESVFTSGAGFEDSLSTLVKNLQGEVTAMEAKLAELTGGTNA